MEELFPCAELAPEQPYMHPIIDSQALGTLPLELLDNIAAFIPQKSLPNFALVRSEFRAVAIRHMYSTVILRASYFRVKPKSSGSALPSPTLPVSELLSLVIIQGCPILRRLLANDDHIGCLRDFRIERYPDTLNRPFFTAFVKHIWNNAKALTKINHEYYPASPSPLPGPSWPNTLQQLETRHICWWTLQALKAPPMRRLSIQNCTQTIAKLHTKDLTHITQFEYLWHDWKGETQEFNFDWIAEAFPNLTKLRIGVCDCWQNQAIPEKVSNRASYMSLSLTFGYLQIYETAFCHLASNLPYLHTITIGEAEERAPLAEETFCIALSQSQPSLEEVRFERRKYYGVSWKRHGPLDNDPSTEKNGVATRKIRKNTPQTCWTPDPTYVGRQAWWFSRFGLPEASLPEMARWRQEGRTLPTERELYDQVFAIVKAELMEQQTCEWERMGKCECVVCVL